VGALLGSLEWRRKAFTLSSPTLGLSANYALAMEHAWSALMLARAIGEPSRIAAGWNNLGTALSGAGLCQAGLRCFEIAIEEVKELAGEAGIATRTAALNNVALSELYLGNFTRGLLAAEEVWLSLEGDFSSRAVTSRLIGGCYLVRLLLETGDVARARMICNALLDMAARAESEVRVAEVEVVDGLCLVFEGPVAAGLARIRRGLDVLRNLQAELRDALQFAIRAYELAGEIAAAAVLRRELSLHNRLNQQQGILEQHRSHLRRLQAEEGTSPVTLERKAEMVERLAITTEMREDSSGLRVFRIGRLARLLAEELGWSDPDAEALEVAARLHDIGKISVADDIVAARRPLTADEIQSMRTHCQVGAELLRQTELENARLAADVAAYHHEAWDGSGYPHGIGGTAIPLAARIVAIADAFVAMTGDRPYQPRLDAEEALARLQAGAGSRYDPALVPQFVALVSRLLASVDDLDGFLAEAASRSPFMQVHEQLTQRLAQEGPSPL
jgi:putative two-component system response regulator